MRSYRDIEKRLAALEQDYQAPELDERARQEAILVTNWVWSSYFQYAQAHLAFVLGDLGTGSYSPYFCGHTEHILKTTDAQLAGRVRPELALAGDRTRRPGPDIALSELFDVTAWMLYTGLAYAEHHPEREVILDALVSWIYADHRHGGLTWYTQAYHPEWLPAGGLAALVDWWFAQGEDADGIL